jgi:hypothetical protein
VPPGAHLLQLTIPGAPPVERHFEVQAGDDPMVLELSASGPTGTPVSVSLDRPAAVYLDGVRVGMGSRIDLPVPPGTHTLGAEAPGFTQLSQPFEVGAQPLSLRVALGEEADNGGLDVARVLVGVPALAATIGAVIAVSGAFTMSGQFEDEIDRQGMEGAMSADELDALADRVEDWALAADVMVGVAGALGVTAIVLLAIPNAPDQPSRLEVGAAPTAGGGVLFARGRFGGDG